MIDFIFGLHESSVLSIDAYHALDAIGKSDLDKIAHSPMHWKYAEREETPAMRIGSAVHCAVLEPERFSADYVIAPECDKRTKAGKEQWVEFETANPGKTILCADDGLLCNRIADAVRSHHGALELLTNGRPEVSALWCNDEFRTRCRARFDWLRDDGLIVDLKTTTDARPTAFARSCASFRYHVQAAWYQDGHFYAADTPPLGFVFIAVEKTAPYAVALYELDDEAIELGRAWAERDLARYATARDLDFWSGYPAEILPLSLPRWALNVAVEA